MSKLKWLFSAAKCGIYYAEIITSNNQDRLLTRTGEQLENYSSEVETVKRETGGNSRSEKSNIRNDSFDGLVTGHEKWKD